ncbi:MAG TPA: UDP-N-acetylmuramoyl-L-alanyl-D-glutamate--2,6-diaminopimelate ligase [Thermoanaerobaculia bacterium]|jgi:UDP-N-acetylmuramoyl-L-alanyl-D-glutamate--2,6-diaminopimelate ligase|nr:UDP-N-acetylmuramoyl-L-alanyl-D-glutamate--2,6-diaminopimelate ligase [Thermoanaerobaculia bacterium]
MRLSELIQDLGLAGSIGADPEVAGVEHDSRRVQPGDLFVALPGERFDGRAFAAAAAAAGAVAVVGPAPTEAAAAVKLPWLVTDAPRALLGPLAARVHGHPERELILAGVTGTNGKSTVATLVAAILTAAGHPAGFIGTLGYSFQGKTYAGAHTTPEASDLFRLLRAMRDDGAAAVAMEVSSHALAMGRVDGAGFDAAAFTNLTRDHLDFHPDLEDYFATKRQLFDRLKAGRRPAVNVDDPYGRRLAAEIPDALTFGERGEVSAREVVMTTAGISGVLVTPRGELPFASGLLGGYNLSNLLAAAAVAETLELPHAAVAAALAVQRPVAGRMEPVDRGQPFAVYVDYAHTDAALDAALRSARQSVGGGKVAVVFGCGGDRDRGKRPLMGQVAGELADLVIATSDNPRSEDPLAILASVEEGLKASGNRSYRLLPDRREAIRAVIAAAEPGWAVVVAGKGHEREQTIGDRKLPFSDLEEIGKALEERFGSPVGR